MGPMEHIWQKIDPTFDEVLAIIDFKFAREQERNDKECARCKAP